MKNTLTICSLIALQVLVGASTSDTTPKGCCQLPAIQEFAALAADKDFVNLHENPMPFTYQNVAGEMITFDATDGQKAYGFMLKAKKESKKYLFIFHEWWGLNDYIKQETEKYYSALKGKVNVIAIDLYDTKVAATREDAAKFVQSVSTERGKAIVEGALKYAGTDAEVATLGWCFGGSWSLQAALIAQQQAKACVIYYGMPEKDVEKLKTLNAKVLGIFASQEKRISPEVVKQFEENMKTAGKSVVVKQYDADHAFANPSNPKYNKEFAEDAFEHSLKFIKKNL
jgi:carboxymethylenebutenolidase